MIEVTDQLHDGNNHRCCYSLICRRLKKKKRYFPNQGIIIITILLFPFLTNPIKYSFTSSSLSKK